MYSQQDIEPCTKESNAKMAMCGGIGEEKEATPEVQAVADKVIRVGARLL